MDNRYLEIGDKIQKYWYPEYFEEYYYIDEGGVFARINEGSCIDERRIVNYNCFQTEQKAEEKLEKIKKLLKEGVE